MTIEMVAYGAGCTWWDDKVNVSTTPSGLPCCPHCGGVLFEMEGDAFTEGARTYEHPDVENYYEFLMWMRGKCYPTMCVAITEWHKHVIERLNQWKVEALEVLKAWEKAYEAAGSPGVLGLRKPEAMLKWVEEHR